MPRLEFDPKAPLVFVSRKLMSENKTGDWRTLTPIIDLKACTGCMLCWKFCPDACVGIQEGKPVIDLDHCKGCGICARECPPGCVHMTEEAAP